MLRFFSILISGISFTVACNFLPLVSADDSQYGHLPEVNSARQARSFAGQRVRVSGNYRPIQRLESHAEILLRDGWGIVLGKAEDARRDSEELLQFKDKRITAIGRIAETCTFLEPDVELETTAWCLESVEAIY